MRDINECWLQTPQILDEEIQLRKELIQTMVGSLYPGILWNEIAKLMEIRHRRLADA